MFSVLREAISTSASERVIQPDHVRRNSPAWENYHENLDSSFGLYDARHSGAC